MDGVGISIIGRPRPLPGHDTPNSAYNTYTLKCEEPVSGPDLLDGLFAPYGGCIELPHACVFGAAYVRFAGGMLSLDRRLYINNCITLYERLL